MKVLFTLSVLFLIVGATFFLPKMPKPDKELTLKQENKALRKDSLIKTNALRKIYASPYWGNLQKDY